MTAPPARAESPEIPREDLSSGAAGRYCPGPTAGEG